MMKNKKTAAIVVCAVIVGVLLLLQPWNKKQGTQNSSEAKTEETDDAETGKTEESAETSTKEAAAFGSTSFIAPEMADEVYSDLSPEMSELKEKLEKELGEKDGRWSMYMYRFDTGEEFGVNAQDSMISASLIKLFIAGCYFEQIEKGVIEDDYSNQLFTMISESNNDSTNRLIDVLGMDTVNEFIRVHGYEASWLKRKMLEKNGQENYTSSEDCGHVLRDVYEGTYINKEASDRIMEALRAQIARNRYKIPAGVPEGIETANKTGELFTTDENGTNVTIQNDAAIIFVPDHPYVLVVMTSVPSAGESEMHRQIAELSSEVYEALDSSLSEAGSAGSEEGAVEITSESSTESADEPAEDKAEDTAGKADKTDEITAEGASESVSEDAAVSLPAEADKK